jgi:hypothetical protein
MCDELDSHKHSSHVRLVRVSLLELDKGTKMISGRKGIRTAAVQAVHKTRLIMRMLGDILSSFARSPLNSSCRMLERIELK